MDNSHSRSFAGGSSNGDRNDGLVDSTLLYSDHMGNSRTELDLGWEELADKFGDTAGERVVVEADMSVAGLVAFGAHRLMAEEVGFDCVNCSLVVEEGSLLRRWCWLEG